MRRIHKAVRANLNLGIKSMKFKFSGQTKNTVSWNFFGGTMSLLVRVNAALYNNWNLPSTHSLKWVIKEGSESHSRMNVTVVLSGRSAKNLKYVFSLTPELDSPETLAHTIATRFSLTRGI